MKLEGKWLEYWDHIKDHLWGPVGSIVFHALVLTILFNFAVNNTGGTGQEVEIRVIEPNAPKLDEVVKQVEEVIKKEEIPQPNPDNTPMDAGVADAATLTPDTGGGGGADTGAGIGSGDTSLPLGFEVSATKSPLVMRGLYANRTAAGRAGALGKYGHGFGAVSEEAVMRALRWLKRNQNADGSWPKTQAAMTGFALLTFLAHGETPASEEFGETVQKAIQWLVDHQDAGGGWPRRYEHEIATYAMCEAYALTKVPMLKEAAEKAIDILVKGQNAKGGWRYTLTPMDESDCTVMGWCAQAVKSAKMAGLENSGLDETLKRAIEGFRGNYAENDTKGGFGYTGPAMSGLTGAGVLCMQLLGKSNSKEVQKGLNFLDEATFNWDVGAAGNTFNKNYYWYYITQAKFHAGGERWTKWDKIFAPTLVKHQTIIKDGIMGPDGKPRDIGFWEMAQEISGHTDGDVMNTCLCTLQLEVYYRYLPTYKPPEATDGGDVAEAKDDVKVNVKIQ